MNALFYKIDFFVALYSDQKMSAGYRVLLTGDLLQQICDYHVIGICKNCVEKECECGRGRYGVTDLADIEAIEYYVKCKRNKTVLNLISVASLSNSDLGKIMPAAAQSGNLYILKLLSTNILVNHPDFSAMWVTILKIAAKNGHLNTTQWIIETCPQSFKFDDLRLLCSAIRSGNLELVKWLLSVPHLYGTLQHMTDKITTAKWLYVNDPIATAVEKGHLHIIDWLYTNGYQHLFRLISWKLVIAAENGYLDILQWFHITFTSKQKMRIGESVEAAATNGHLHVIKWLYENNQSRSVDISAAVRPAIESGDLDTVKWIYDCTKIRNPDVDNMNGWYRDAKINAIDLSIETALSHGHIDVVKWFYEKERKQWSNKCLVGAAVNGHLEMLKWTYHNGWGPLTDHDRIFSSAVCGDNIDIVEWMCRDLDIDDTTILNAIDKAASFGLLKMLEFLHDKLSDTKLMHASKAMRIAAENGRLDIVKWLHKKGYRYPQAMGRAALGGNIEIVKFLHYNGYQSGDVMKVATAYGFLAIINWLYQKGYDCAGIRDTAAEFGQVHILKWLSEKKL